jgi:hypothetical protein
MKEKHNVSTSQATRHNLITLQLSKLNLAS